MPSAALLVVVICALVGLAAGWYLLGPWLGDWDEEEDEV